jgi:hypothetical protein
MSATSSATSFAATEGAGEAEQQHGAVAQVAQRGAGRGHGDRDIRCGGLLADGGGADRAPNAGEHRLDLVVAGGRVIASNTVEIANGC